MDLIKPTVYQAKKVQEEAKIFGEEKVVKILSKNELVPYTMGESLVMDRENNSITDLGNGKQVIKFEMENISIVNDLYVPFGTLMGVIGNTIDFIFPQYTIGVAGLTSAYKDAFNFIDNTGAGAYYLYDLNTMFFNKPVVMSGFEVITDSEEQRKEPLILVDYPMQVEDSRSKKSPFIQIYTQVTSAQIQKNPAVLGMTKGVIYKILKGEKMVVNITVGACDEPNMVVKEDDCDDCC